MKSALLPALALLGFSGLAQAQNLDIMGIGLGSSYTDALSRLAGQGFRNSSIGFPATWSQMSGDLAAKEEPVARGVVKNRSFEYVIVQALSGRVVYVAHEISYGDNPEPNDLVTVEALKTKYGKPTLEETPKETETMEGRRLPTGTNEAGSYVFDWTFNASGKLVSEYGPDHLSCGAGGGRFQGGNSNVRYIGPVTTIGTGIQCSNWASGRVYGDPRNGQLVGSMYMTVADVATLKTFFQANRQVQQDRVNRQGDAGKSTKAPL